MTHESQQDHDPKRRRLLRRAATVAATTAGAGVAAAVGLPGTAQAAPGDNLIMGTTNDAGPTTTTVTGGAHAALDLQSAGGVPLRLVPSSGLYPAVLDSEVGSLAVDDQGDLFVRAGAAGAETNGWAWTSEWATTSVAIAPTRVLDTRDANLRRTIVSGADKLDSTGRLVPGYPIVVALDSYVRDGYAVKGNVTVAGMTGGGVLTVWGAGTKPATSTLNWWTSGQVLSNFLFTELGAVGSYRSVLTLQATASPTHVILDITSLLVGHPSQVLVSRA